VTRLVTDVAPTVVTGHRTRRTVPPVTAPYGYDTGPPAADLPGVDPTKALWRRIFAYAIDGLVASLIVLGLGVALGDVDTVDARRCPDDLPDDRICLDLTTGGDTDDDEQILLMDGSAAAIALGAGLVWGLVNNVLLQGATGATVGKFITACRTVKPDGSPCGAGRAFVRTLLLVIDTISCILPIGLWVAIFSRGHRRIGDMAADTYVVKARYAGRPVRLT
jgi:uncharacterized RDD family membrane protein YckC